VISPVWRNGPPVQPPYRCGLTAPPTTPPSAGPSAFGARQAPERRNRLTAHRRAPYPMAVAAFMIAVFRGCRAAAATEPYR
jgi:hypothetical protein